MGFSSSVVIVTGGDSKLLPTMLVAATVMSYFVDGVRCFMIAVFFSYCIEVDGASSVGSGRNILLVSFCIVYNLYCIYLYCIFYYCIEVDGAFSVGIVVEILC